MDYTETFPEDTGFCLHEKQKLPSTEFTIHLNKVKGNKNPREISYWAYVCEICLLPSKWYIQYCWWCMEDFYGSPGYDKCLRCKTQEEKEKEK